MKNLQRVLIMFFSLSFLVFFTACEDQGPAEEAGEKIDNMVEESKEGVEEAGENIREGMEEAGDKIEEAADKMQN